MEQENHQGLEGTRKLLRKGQGRERLSSYKVFVCFESSIF